MLNFKRILNDIDAILLQKELHSAQKHWTQHFNTAFYEGSWSGIALRSPEQKRHPLSAGEGNGQTFRDEAILEQLPYTKQIIDSIATEKYSIRYLKLKAGSEIKLHQDYDMIFWDGMVRLHIPVVTNDQVLFEIDGQAVPMQRGECWFADFSKPHRVINKGLTDRIHLVIDCGVNPWLKNLFIKEGIIGADEQRPDPIDSYSPATKAALIESLLQMNTETSIRMAKDLAEKYGLEGGE